MTKCPHKPQNSPEDIPQAPTGLCFMLYMQESKGKFSGSEETLVPPLYGILMSKSMTEKTIKGSTVVKALPGKPGQIKLCSLWCHSTQLPVQLFLFTISTAETPYRDRCLHQLFKPDAGLLHQSSWEWAQISLQGVKFSKGWRQKRVVTSGCLKDLPGLKYQNFLPTTAKAAPTNMMARL